LNVDFFDFLDAVDFCTKIHSIQKIHIQKDCITLWFKKNAMIFISSILFAIYCISMSCIVLYSFLQFNLWRLYFKKTTTQTPPPLTDYPLVTIQLPIYNEQYVANRLIDNIVQLDYPLDRFEIQVLDDSTDDTSALIARKVQYYQTQKIQIVHIQRKNRTGFKAGALRDALPQATGAFIAIFDADFLPKSNFLKQMLPYFENPKVGVVQGRWEHINDDYSLLTRIQALQLNVHFTIEQVGRQNGNFLLQFNGTAGLWRRTAIEDAGGWEADTLTEDLDLSYRAQLRGWQIEYVEKVGVPSELPVEMNGLKAQQFRWMKGGAENARKLLRKVWQQPFSMARKIHATQHLLASSIFLMLFLASITSLPLLYFFPKIGFSRFFFYFVYSSFGIFFLLILTANLKENIRKKSFWIILLEIMVVFPFFMLMMSGLCWHNAIAVLEGLLGKKSDFVRTPKYDIRIMGDMFHQKSYITKYPPISTFVEGVLAILFLGAAIWGVNHGVTVFWLFHLNLGVGFGTICLLSIAHLKQ
jgi:cellulose synthase/poly-beta-1,6-N-acetylglucosamine synthase-like glycosyltransferase